MKKILLSILTAAMMLAAPAYAQTTVPQGGTGVTSIPDKYIMMGSTTLRTQSVSTTTLSTLMDIVGQARAAISSSITGITYTPGTGVFSLTSGYGIPLTASTTNWNGFYDTPSTRITAGTNMSWAGNTLNGLADSAIRALFSNSATGLTYNNSTGATSLTAGYNIPLTASTTNWNSFWDTPSTRITAGANCLWTGNSINCTSAGGATTTINGANGPTFSFVASSTGATDFAISTSTGVVTFHIPDASATARGLISTTTQTITGAKTFTGANAYGTPASITLTNGTGLPIGGITGLGTGVETALAVNTGSAGAFVVNGGALGTPSSGTLTNATGLPVSTGISGLGTGIATWLATPSSANLLSALTTKTGTGNAVFDTSPTLVTPILGVASSTAITIPTLYSTTRANIWGLLADSTNATGTLGMVLSSTGTSTQWITPNAGTVTAVSVASANGFAGSSSGGATPQLTLSTTATGLLQGNGTAISGITNSSTVGQVLRTTGASTYAWGAVDLADTDAVTGTLAVANGGTGITSFGSGIATWLGTPSAANLRTAVTGTTGTAGNLVFSTSPTLTTPILGVASSTALSVSGDFWVTGTSTHATSTVSRFTATGHATLATASSTGLTSSGTLNVSGQTTLATASSTGLTATNLYSTTGVITKNTVTNASTTNETISGILYDSTNAPGTSGQVLQSNGTSVSWATPSGGGSFLAATTTNASISSSAAETTLGTISIPGGTFGTNRGIKFKIVMSNSRSGYGGAETHRIKYGGTTLYTMTDDPAGTPSEGPTFIYEGMILANNATNAQEASIAYTQSGASSVGVAGSAQGTSAIDSTSAQNLTITGQCGDATPVCTVTLLSYLIEKIQ